MLLQAGVLLCCAALCITSPLPPSTAPDCPPRGLILEAISDIQTISSKARTEIMPQDDLMKAGGNMTTYLEGFIEALRRSKKKSEEILLAQKLQKIQDTLKLCHGQMEQGFDPQGKNFFSILDYFLRFLNHYGLKKRE